MINVETDGPITIVEIDRPDSRNAIDGPTADALRLAFQVFDADDSQLVAVLAGAGEHFCAGADLTAFTDPDRMLSIAAPPAPGPLGCTRMRLSKPVIAAVEGYAVAGGLELAVWADMRVAAESAVFGALLSEMMNRDRSRSATGATRASRRSRRGVMAPMNSRSSFRSFACLP